MADKPGSSQKTNGPATMIKIEKTEVLTESKTRQPITPRWLKIPAAVAYSGISRSAIYELLNARKIKSHLIGAARVIDRESIDAFISGQPAEYKSPSAK